MSENKLAVKSKVYNAPSQSSLEDMSRQRTTTNEEDSDVTSASTGSANVSDGGLCTPPPSKSAAVFPANSTSSKTVRADPLDDADPVIAAPVPAEDFGTLSSEPPAGKI